MSHRMTEPKYCIVCLTTDVKLFNIKDYVLGQIYSDLTTISVENWSQNVCFVCAALLRKYQQFKAKCIRTNEILKSVSLTGLSKNLLKSIQTQNNLGSNLILCEITNENTVNTNSNFKIEEIDTESDDGNFEGLISQQNDRSFPVEYSKTNVQVPCKVKQKNEYNKQKTDKSHDVFNTGSDVKCETIDEIADMFDVNVPKVPIRKNVIKRKKLVKRETDCDWNMESDSSDRISIIKRVKKSNKLSTKEGGSISLHGHKQNISTKTDEIKDKRRIVNNKKAKQIIKDIVKKSKAENKGDGSVKEIKLSLYKNDYLKKYIEHLGKYGTLQVLTQEQAKNEVLSRANSNNYMNLPHKCNLCFRGFEREETLNNHMVRHDPQQGEYECDICHSRFSSKKILTRHLYCSHRVKFTCDACSCVFDTVYAVTKHIDYHNGKTYDCKFCEQKFKIRNTLSMHVQVKHQNEFDTQYICEFCGGVYINERGFKTHKRKIHFNVENDRSGPLCKRCGVHFASQQAWERHLVLSGKHNVDNGCKRCGMRFETSFELRKHMKIHARPKTRHKQESRTYICQFCGKELSAEYYYKRHLYKLHGQAKPNTKPQPAKKFICEICGGKFMSKSALETHTWKHTGELPHKCQHCNKGFRLRMSLKVHENLHTRAKVYKCDVCDKEFLRQDSYDRHVRQHKGNTHQCLECDRSFINMWNLKSHIKRKHGHDT